MVKTENVRGSQVKVPPIEFNSGDGYGTIYVRSNIKKVTVTDPSDPSRTYDEWQYDEIQYTYEEYVEVMNKNQAIQGNMIAVLMLSSPAFVKVFSDIPDDASIFIANHIINTFYVYGEDKAKDTYKSFMEHPVWSAYKTTVDTILIDSGHADLISP